MWPKMSESTKRLRVPLIFDALFLLCVVSFGHDLYNIISLQSLLTCNETKSNNRDLRKPTFVTRPH